jgi:hypothetical protein
VDSLPGKGAQVSSKIATEIENLQIFASVEKREKETLLPKARSNAAPSIDVKCGQECCEWST